MGIPPSRSFTTKLGEGGGSAEGAAADGSEGAARFGLLAPWFSTCPELYRIQQQLKEANESANAPVSRAVAGVPSALPLAPINLNVVWGRDVWNHQA